MLLSAAGLWSQVEDTENEHIYHKELFTLTKMKKDEPHTLAFTIPLFEPLPPCYFVRAISNRSFGVPAPLHASAHHSAVSPQVRRLLGYSDPCEGLGSHQPLSPRFARYQGG